MQNSKGVSAKSKEPENKIKGGSILGEIENLIESINVFKKFNWDVTKKGSKFVCIGSVDDIKVIKIEFELK